MSAQMTFGRRLTDALSMFLVAAVSIVLLIYVAFGEAKRTYEQFQIEKLVAQGQVVQNSVESFIKPGLPVQQFVGFNQLADPMVKADPLIDAISFYDLSGQRIFNSGEAGLPLLGADAETRQLSEGGVVLKQEGSVLQVVLPIANRFEQVGIVVLSVPRDKVAGLVEDSFVPLAKAGAIAAVAFGLFVLFFTHGMSATGRWTWVGGGFVAMFLLVAALVVSTLVNVYSQGAQARAKSLADSLGQRLDDLVMYNINLDEITGIIALFGDYKRLNPEIRSAALIVDGKVRAHVDPKARGNDWDHVATDYEYTVDISQPVNPRQVLVKVALPREIVWRQVLRSVKNFAALLVASGFLAALFMGVARSLQRLSEINDDRWSLAAEKAVIDLVKPVFFLAVFVEHLSYAFLPGMMVQAVAKEGLPSSFASLPFALYYLVFALALVPAGRLERRLGAKTLMVGGLIAAGAGLALLTWNHDFWVAVAARTLSGLGQGVLFIGVQAYVLANSSAAHRTQAGGAIVFGFQAGMIGGMAIGSLLVSYMGPEGVFTLASSIAVLTALYGWVLLPRQVAGTEPAMSPHAAWREMIDILRDSSFLRSILLVGMPAKAVLTGVILFAMPLLLSQQGYAKEDVGQITMLYATAVILASHYAALRTDRTADTESILFWGTTVTAIGLAMVASVSLLDANANVGLSTLLIVGGVVLVGIAHGCINAPIVTHVAQCEAAERYGMANAAATYRLMERVGHVLGPVIVGQIFLHFGTSWTTLGWIAGCVFLLGMLFLTPGGHQDDRQTASRSA